MQRRQQILPRWPDSSPASAKAAPKARIRGLPGRGRPRARALVPSFPEARRCPCLRRGLGWRHGRILQPGRTRRPRLLPSPREGMVPFLRRRADRRPVRGLVRASPPVTTSWAMASYRERQDPSRPFSMPFPSSPRAPFPLMGLSVLYILAPQGPSMRDLRRNLELPLSGIASFFEARGVACPDIRVETRSGRHAPVPSAGGSSRGRPRSSARHRRASPSSSIRPGPGRCFPESGFLSWTRSMPWQVPSAAPSSRFPWAALSLLAGEFQRVALSATLKPPEEAARFVGGLALERRVRW